MGNLCIIPARGGSKRIPRKNIKEFLGKPIIAYSIELALKSGLFDEVMVSTDDSEIAGVAKLYGAKVPILRSKNNANDFATLADVIDEVLGAYENNFESICCILPTAVLCTSKQLEEGFETLKNSSFDSVRPIVKFSYPIQRSFTLSQEGKVDWFYPKYEKARTQDLKPAFHDAGQFYWFRYENGLRSHNRGAFVIEASTIQDIDTEEDWSMAELKYKLKNEII
jgi:N-acylneuraminate cytidylyltransferase